MPGSITNRPTMVSDNVTKKPVNVASTDDVAVTPPPVAPPVETVVNHTSTGSDAAVVDNAATALVSDQDALNTINANALGTLADGKQTWDQKAVDDATILHEMDVAKAREAALASRRNVESNAAKAAIDDAMMSYKVNQTVDRMGWSGGSKMDANTQMEYLKMSIAADMYGQMELQKMGFSTELAKARAAYDANMQELAMRYEEQAYQRSVQEYDRTGLWVDPSIRDTVDQYTIARNTINDPNASETDRASARNLITTIQGWFYNGEDNSMMSEAGLNALATIVQMPRQTLTSVQIQALLADNAIKEQALLRSTTEDTRDATIMNADGIPYTDPTTGVARRLDPFTVEPTEVAAVKQYFTQYPSDLNTAIKSVIDTQAFNAYDQWKKADTEVRGNISFENYLKSPAASDFINKAKHLISKYGGEGLSYTSVLAGVKFDATGIAGATGSGGSGGGDDDDSVTGDVSQYTTALQSGMQAILRDHPSNVDPTTGNYIENVNGNLRTGTEGKTFTDSNTEAFRNFIGTFKDGSNSEKGEQVAYANTILSAVNQGLVPNGTLVSFNYGQVKNNAGYALVVDGKLFKVDVMIDGRQNDTGTQRHLKPWIPNGYVLDGTKIRKG